jgi:Zn-finger nucleic acid-binding protein
MSDPYRDSEPLACPACNAALRSFHERLCCDACGSVMLELDDLVAAITEIIGDGPALKLVHGKPGARACPRCKHAMASCHLDVEITEHHRELKPTLDRCASHGVWFDTDELADILTVLHRSAEPPSHATVRQIARTMLVSFGSKYGFRTG